MDQKQSTEKTDSSQSESSTLAVYKRPKEDTPPAQHLIAKPSGIQWQSIRDLVQWKALRNHVFSNEVNVIQTYEEEERDERKESGFSTEQQSSRPSIVQRVEVLDIESKAKGDDSGNESGLGSEEEEDKEDESDSDDDEEEEHRIMKHSHQIQNESFDDLSKCRIEIPSEFMKEELTKFIRYYPICNYI